MTDERVVHSEKKKNGLFKEPTCALFEMTGELVAFGLEAKEIYLKRLAEGNLFSFTNGVPKNLRKTVCTLTTIS